MTIWNNLDLMIGISDTKLGTWLEMHLVTGQRSRWVSLLINSHRHPGSWDRL